MKPVFKLFWLLAIAILLGACSEADSPQAEIRAMIDDAVEAAEARDSGDLADMIHAGYQDEKGHNKKQLGSLLRAYFFRHKNIHLFTKIGEIEMLSENRAQVRMHVAMAGSVIADVDALAGLRARIYAFELTLVKQDDWQLQHASWRSASVADL